MKKISIFISLIFLFILSILLTNIIINNNKYNHYKIYDKSSQLNEIFDEFEFTTGFVDPCHYNVSRNITEQLVFNKEPVTYNINEVEKKYYVCGYVNKDIKEKIYSFYHHKLSELHEQCGSRFVRDSFFHAYLGATKGFNGMMDLNEWKEEIYFNNNEYPITWYIIEEDKKIYKQRNNEFLLGVLEIKELTITGILSNTSINIPILLEKYEYRLSDLDPIQYINNFNYYDRPFFLSYERITDKVKYINYSGWNQILSKIKKGFLLEYELHDVDVTKIEIINDEEYIDLGYNSKIKIFNDDYTFQNYIDCIIDNINNNHYHSDECEFYNYYYDGEGYETYLFFYWTDYYKCITKLMKENGELNRIHYFIKLDDLIDFLSKYRNYDIHKYN